MPAPFPTVLLRSELKDVREQVDRMARERKNTKAPKEFEAAHFSALFHLTECLSHLDKIAEGK